eukprot:CAMPEP_0118654596 /NCGR_PEP_ID=MMETSP0785-20121206/12477_1 /TAXON_ID=91992 /ORGANISM="Bolidomonas pacifica, Strain CCMP 1866" /LENGTH=314 /DNA_ID=CAMNT_0006547273 /DNA_START=120 /DNA_END=1061 /DNA_ORIENTATION=+
MQNTSSYFHDSDVNPSGFISPFDLPSNKPRSTKTTMLSIAANDANEERKKILATERKYLEACDEKGTAPSSCIVRNVCKDTMPLSNLLLGDKGVAALAMSITISLRDLDLSSNGLTSEALLHLSPCLPNSSITKLNLARNGIGDAGALSLFKVLRHSKLRSLCLSLNKVGDKGVEGLLEHIPMEGPEVGHPEDGGGGMQSGTTKRLDANKNVPPHPPSAKIPNTRSPRASLAYAEPPLEVLNLSSNLLTALGFQHLSSFLSKGPFRLRNLDLSWNTGGNQGCLAIVNSLGKKGSEIVENLNLAFNGLTDEGGAR